MLETLLKWDISLFRLINQAHNPFMDELMFLISTKWLWIPFYALILFFLIKKNNTRNLIILLLGIGLTITSTDQFTSSLLKPSIKRYRPCQVESGLDFDVHRVNNKCGGKYGFASSHSANFFGLATFLALVFRDPRWNSAFFAAAFLVAYSRIYLGVHYPLDVFAGALIGISFGWLWWRISQIFR
ncbi:MAG: phosphatase PAP2 family protein [Bacteroidia bacterium]|nr:phosphatase PAP2 family protein [Bacteroidia bacterium]